LVIDKYCYQLLKLFQGELTITADMESLGNSLYLDLIPEGWAIKAYPSLFGLAAWYADLLLRIKELICCIIAVKNDCGLKNPPSQTAAGSWKSDVQVSNSLILNLFY
jgi:hypothetical protein